MVSQEGIAMKYWMIAMGIFGLDTAVKNNIDKKKDWNKLSERTDSLLLIRKSHNSGMAMNLGDKYPNLTAMLSLLFTAVLTLVFLVSLLRKGKLRAGLSLLLGGALSNTCDRLRRNYVVDYVSFNVPFKRLRNIVFNLGDFAIFLGTVMIVLDQIADNQ